MKINKRFAALDLDDAPSGSRRSDVVPAIARGGRSTDETVVVDDTRRARVLADDDAVEAIGLDLKDPVYEWGTSVNSTGVANAAKFRRDWENGLTLDELERVTNETIASQNRRDYEGRVSGLSVNPDGTVRMTKENISLAMTDKALGGLVRRLEMGPYAASYFTNGVVPTERMALNLNMAIMDAAKMERIPEVMLRTWRIGRERAAFATVSPGYTAFDANSVVSALASGIREAGIEGVRCQSTLKGSRMMSDVIFHSNIEAASYAAGEVFEFGIRVKSADDGTGSISVEVFAQRNRCVNLYILSKAEMTIDTIRHTGRADAIARRVYDAAVRSIELGHHFVEKWGFASNDRVTIAEARDKPAEVVVRAALSGLAERSSFGIGKRQVERIAAHYASSDASEQARDGLVTRQGISDAISRYAHHELDRWSAASLEEAAGNLTWSGTSIDRYVNVSVLRAA